MNGICYTFSDKNCGFIVGDSFTVSLYVPVWFRYLLWIVTLFGHEIPKADVYYITSVENNTFEVR